MGVIQWWVEVLAGMFHEVAEELGWDVEYDGMPSAHTMSMWAGLRDHRLKVDANLDHWAYGSGPGSLSGSSDV